MNEAEKTTSGVDVAGRLDGLVSHQHDPITQKRYRCSECKESIFVYALKSWLVGPKCGDCRKPVANAAVEARR